MVAPTNVLSDAGTRRFHRLISRVLTSNIRVILVSLGSVAFVSDSKLNALIILLGGMQDLGHGLCVYSVGSRIQVLFRLADVSHIFSLCRSQTRFRQSILKTWFRVLHRTIRVTLGRRGHRGVISKTQRDAGQLKRRLN